MQPRPGESLSATDIQALDDQAQVGGVEPEDIGIEQWIAGQAAQSQQVSTIDVGGKAIKIAAVSEGEENRLLKQSRKPNPQTREMKVDPLVYRRLYVAFSLTKANGRTIQPDSLIQMPPGTLTRLQTEIQKLSQYELPERNQDPFAFLS